MNILEEACHSLIIIEHDTMSTYAEGMKETVSRAMKDAAEESALLTRN
jgi:hypothetical protein